MQQLIIIPVVLIVEDRPEALKIRRSLFETQGFNSIGVDNYKDAMTELKSNPALDILVAASQSFLVGDTLNGGLRSPRNQGDSLREILDGGLHRVPNVVGRVPASRVE